MMRTGVVPRRYSAEWNKSKRVSIKADTKSSTGGKDDSISALYYSVLLNFVSMYFA